jgi:UrcA family protein
MSATYIRAAALGCAFAIALGATAAIAQATVQEIVVHPRDNPLAETRHKTVSYGDLNLNSHSGQEVVLRRIKVAAKDVCSPAATSTKEKVDYKKCYDGAVSSAVSDLGNNGVASMYASNK